MKKEISKIINKTTEKATTNTTTDMQHNESDEVEMISNSLPRNSIRKTRFNPKFLELRENPYEK